MRELINAAVAGKTTLFVGHLENYNPAVIRLKQELPTRLKASAVFGPAAIPATRPASQLFRSL
jgi:hypothetical protein